MSETKMSQEKYQHIESCAINSAKSIHNDHNNKCVKLLQNKNLQYKLSFHLNNSD